MKGGDACVALGVGCDRHEQDEGDASVPSPLNPTPAPTDSPGFSQKTYQGEGDRKGLHATSAPPPPLQ